MDGWFTKLTEKEIKRLSDYLKAGGIDVIHIMDDGKVQPHPFTSAAQVRNGKLSYEAPDSSNQRQEKLKLPATG